MPVRDLVSSSISTVSAVSVNTSLSGIVLARIVTASSVFSDFSAGSDTGVSSAFARSGVSCGKRVNTSSSASIVLSSLLLSGFCVAFIVSPPVR